MTSLRGRIAVMLVAFLALLTAFGVLAALSVAERERTVTELDTHIIPGRELTGGLLVALIDQQSGVRGFVITGDPVLLESYHAGQADSAAAIVQLRQLLADFPDLIARVASIERLEQQWRGQIADPEIAAVIEGAPDAAADIVDSGVGQATFAAIRAEVQSLQDELDVRQAEVQARFATARARVTIALWVVLAGGAAGAVAAAFLLQRWTVAPLERLSTDVRSVAAGKLDRRITASGPPEVKRLGRDVDRMRRRILDELDGAVRARQALEQSGPVMMALRDELDPRPVPLPPALTLAARFRPATGVLAGDWYDARPLDETTVAIVVVDVSGHGPRSGVFALRTKQLFLAAFQEGLAPGDTLGWVSQHLGDTGDAFLTGVLLELDTSTGRCSYANAGHPPPLRVTPEGCSALEPTGPLLGPLPGSWDTAECTLGSGDLLVVYTDALVESRDQHGEEFGEQRLAGVIRRHRAAGPEAVAEASVDAVASFVRASASDDLTVVVAAVEPVPAGAVRDG